MVKIIDGEIVADDDPRVLQRSAGPAPTSTRGPAAPAPPPAHGSVLNFNAPPLRVVQPAPGQIGGLGLAGVEVFGLYFSPASIVGVALAAYFLGWKGLVAALVLYYIYKINISSANTAAQAAPAAGQPAGAGRGPAAGLTGGLDGMFQQFMGLGAAGAAAGAPAGRQPAAQGAARGSPSGAAADSGATGGGGRSFSGRAYKLGSS